jgi:hypothetical protein
VTRLHPILVGIATLTITIAASAQDAPISLAACNTACDNCLRISEPVLTDPSETWKGITQMKGALADTMLNVLQLTDTIGAETDAKIYKIRSCSLNETLTLSTYHVVGSAGGRDESIYAVIIMNGTPISHTCIGILTTDCSSTYVRGCAVEEDGTLRIAELEHTFDCDTDALLSTQPFDDTLLRLRADGLFEPVR